MRQRLHAAPRGRKRLRPVGVLLFTCGFLLASVTAAFAYFTVGVINRSPFALTEASSLSAPSGARAVVDGSAAITIDWRLPSQQLAGARYRVIRTTGAESPVVVCTVRATVSTCADSGLTPDTTYDYAIMAVLGSNWQSTPIRTAATTAISQLRIGLSPAPYTAGKRITIPTVTAMTGGRIDTSYTGAKTIDWSGLGRSPSGRAPLYPTRTLRFVNGVAQADSAFMDYAAGTGTLTAADAHDPGMAGSVVFAIGSARPGLLAITAPPAPIAAGGTVSLGVTIEDAYGNTVATGPGSTDSIRVSLSPGSFHAGATTKAAVGGLASFSGLQIETAGTYTITAVDTSQRSVKRATTKPFSVYPAKLVITSKALSGPSAATLDIGPVTVERETAGGEGTTQGSLVAKLSSNPSAGATFGADRFGDRAETDVTFAPGESTVTFWFGDTRAGTVIISVSAPDYLQAAQSEQITGGSLDVSLSSSAASAGNGTRTLTLATIRPTGASFTTGDDVVTMTNIGTAPVEDLTARFASTSPDSALARGLSICLVSAGYVIYNGPFPQALGTWAILGDMAAGTSDTYTLNIYAGDETTPCGAVSTGGDRAEPGTSTANGLNPGAVGETVSTRITVGYSGEGSA